MPNHMLCPAIGAPYSDCIPKVSQRKAPGAISAIALIVNPVRPRVVFFCSPPEFSAATSSFLKRQPLRSTPLPAHPYRTTRTSCRGTHRNRHAKTTTTLRTTYKILISNDLYL